MRPFLLKAPFNMIKKMYKYKILTHFEVKISP